MCWPSQAVSFFSWWHFKQFSNNSLRRRAVQVMPHLPPWAWLSVPLAFPTIVTPYGTAALIIFIALSPTRQHQLTVGLILLGIMLLNLSAMLAARHILRFLGVFLQILGAVLGIIQVSLGLDIILSTLRIYWSN